MTRLATAAIVLISVITAPPAHATVSTVVDTIARSGGRYVRGGASLLGSDCSGLVSVAQSLATGEPIHRYGNTTSLIAGRWPGAIKGATPADVFIIGTNSSHMTARVNGINIESRSSGEPFRIGADARSPFDFPHVYHIDDRLLVI